MNDDHLDIAIGKAPTAGNHAALWSLLNEAGKEQLSGLADALNRIASEPGSSVFFDALKVRGSAINPPIIYSAIDIRTHLLISRLYFTKTVASSLDFLGFVLRSFPFQVKGIITRRDSVFAEPGDENIPHRFGLTALHLGIRQTVCQDSDAELCNFFGRYFFDGEFHGSLDETGERFYYLQLRNYLNFHNHNRLFPALGGMTAIESLRAFPAFSSIRLFDPFPYLNSPR